MKGSRWPRWVYERGTEPDYRFSLANERTFLAWIRTSLAMLAGSVALTGLDLDISPRLSSGLAALLLILCLFCAGGGWFRWARVESAMRRERPLPSAGSGFVLALAITVAALAFLVIEV